MKKLIFFTLLMSSLFLSGCVSNYVPPRPQAGDASNAKLVEAATAASRSLTTLEGIRKAENPQYKKKLPSANSFGMREPASIDWTGPMLPIVQKIAKASSYRLQVLGNPPSIPIIITIHAQNKTLGEILQNIDYQAGKKAYIYVNAKASLIQLKYAIG